MRSPTGASGGQGIGEAVGQSVEGEKAPLADAAVFLLVDDRNPVRVGHGPKPGCRRADVEGLRDLPLKTAHQLGIGLGGQQGSVRRFIVMVTLSEFEPWGRSLFPPRVHQRRDFGISPFFVRCFRPVIEGHDSVSI